MHTRKETAIASIFIIIIFFLKTVMKYFEGKMYDSQNALFSTHCVSIDLRSTKRNPYIETTVWVRYGIERRIRFARRELYKRLVMPRNRIRINATNDIYTYFEFERNFHLVFSKRGARF